MLKVTYLSRSLIFAIGTQFLKVFNTSKASSLSEDLKAIISLDQVQKQRL